MRVEVIEVHWADGFYCYTPLIGLVGEFTATPIELYLRPESYPTGYQMGYFIADPDITEENVMYRSAKRDFYFYAVKVKEIA